MGTLGQVRGGTSAVPRELYLAGAGSAQVLATPRASDVAGPYEVRC